MNRIVTLGLAVLAAGCATKDEASYWTKKSDLLIVHHIKKTSSGLIDSTEKLSTKKVDDGLLDKYDVPKDKYYSVLASDQPVKLADKGKKPELKKKEPES